ncbi:Transposase zinc-ribbon domain protein [Bacteroidales bacterium Barb6XT]|nr:Transposase zinc-ribbon domain protein [Bacteroidales bacterium Barb6XT]
MNLLNFVSEYPNEASCRHGIKECRDRQGVVCPKCGHTEHYWKSDKESYECKNAEPAKVYVPIRSCTVPICLFVIGLSPFIY